MRTFHISAAHLILTQYDVRSKKRAQKKMTGRRWNGTWSVERPGFVFRTFQGILRSGFSTDLKVQRKKDASHHPTWFYVGSVKGMKGYPA